MEGQVIIEIEAEKANKKVMSEKVTGVTGDPNPFFCPPIKEGKPYRGHTHVFPPSGATNVSEEKITVPDSGE